MPIRGVLFDFSGTLFRLEADEVWLDAALRKAGAELDETVKANLLDQLTTPTGHSVRLPDHLRDAWHRRDLDPALHHKIYRHVLNSFLEHDAAAEEIYAQLTSPANWFPYPDTADTLRHLRKTGIAVGVVSNIAWDIRDAFTRYDLREDVDAFVLSYEFGAMKPEASIFRHACQAIGVPPDACLMVGDSEVADGGATALGTPLAVVEPLPTTRRPRALLDVLEAHDLR
ncbi:MAG: HAD-IA family hydrolase [Pseudonocardiaceae bacterium]|nr:HAD-IA family hydrolase [Pseudonocardiaceae bacterium]